LLWSPQRATTRTRRTATAIVLAILLRTPVVAHAQLATDFEDPSFASARQSGFIPEDGWLRAGGGTLGTVAFSRDELSRSEGGVRLSAGPFDDANLPRLTYVGGPDGCHSGTSCIFMSGAFLLHGSAEQLYDIIPLLISPPLDLQPLAPNHVLEL